MEKNTGVYLLFTQSFLLSSIMLISIENDIIVKPKWHDLDRGNHHKITEFGGKWILVGSITFKKRCKDPICLEELSLHWNGATINNLTASLYRKNSSKTFLPIEKNLICDGIWNKNKQSLIFSFDDKETLFPTTTFYLVLTVPGELETILSSGTFSLEQSCLPKPFKQCAQAVTLSITNT